MLFPPADDARNHCILDPIARRCVCVGIVPASSICRSLRQVLYGGAYDPTRNIVLGGIAALAIGGVAGSAQAMETGTFQNRLNGATIGLPLGALPPAGLYTGLETAYLGPLVGSGNSGASTGNQCARLASGACAALPAIAQAVPLLWVPGWNFLGATYGASVVQAFYNFETCGLPNGGCGGGSPIIGGGFVFTNTFINPITLSWNWVAAGSCRHRSTSRLRTAPKLTVCRFLVHSESGLLDLRTGPRDLLPRPRLGSVG